MKTVLLVDYDPSSIDSIRRALVRVGVRTVLATDGEAGEREFHRTLPDLTLVQDVIPKKRGIELCRDIKRSLPGPEHPVILIAFAQNGTRAKVIEARCDDWIAKPFNEGALLDKVRKFLPELIVAGASHWCSARHPPGSRGQATRRRPS